MIGGALGAEAWGFVGQVAAITVALVLAYSAAAKSRDLRRAAIAFADLGVTRRPTLAHGIGLVAVESLVAIASAGAFVAGIRLAMIPAVLLTLGFVVVLGRLLATGSTAECFCFGTSEPVRPKSMIRTTLLLLASLVAATAPQGSPPERLSALLVAVSTLAVGALTFRFAELWTWNSDVCGREYALADEVINL